MWQRPPGSTLSLRKGRFFDRTDEDTHAAVRVIGEKVRRDLFGFEPALGRPLKVNDQWLTVVGVLEGGGLVPGRRRCREGRSRVADG